MAGLNFFCPHPHYLFTLLKLKEYPIVRYGHYKKTLSLSEKTTHFNLSTQVKNCFVNENAQRRGNVAAISVIKSVVQTKTTIAISSVERSFLVDSTSVKKSAMLVFVQAAGEQVRNRVVFSTIRYIQAQGNLVVALLRYACVTRYAQKCPYLLVHK